MLFHSYEYLFFFLPLVWTGCWAFSRLNMLTITRCFLLAASLVFYAWWEVSFLRLLLVSMGFHYLIGKLLLRQRAKHPTLTKLLLLLGVSGDVLLLGFYKYAGFFTDTLNQIFKTDFSAPDVVLPLAISFYTFQQIGFIAAVYRGQVVSYTLLDYALFASFFPSLISGPIAKPQELLEPLRHPLQAFSSRQLAAGFYQFALGMGKKVLIADTLKQWVDMGYAAETLICPEAWMLSVAYTLQIYFDFSGYSDMAIGTARMLHIELPVNFDSPYVAVNIQEFWRRWHITLGRFLRENIYIPLGGSRKGLFCTCVNTFLTFVLCGLWHGAGWNFILWGGLHGLALILWRIFHTFGGKIPKFWGWVGTMLFVNAAWVFFRAPDLPAAWRVLRAMVDIPSLVFPAEWIQLPVILAGGIHFGVLLAILLLVCGLLVLLFPNSGVMARDFAPCPETTIFVAVVMACSILELYGVNEFIYFSF